MLGCSRTEREDLVVAKVDARTITIREFEMTEELLENKYLPETKDLEGKKEILKHMINREIMTLKAYEFGYEKDEEFKAFWDKFKGPFLVAALWNEEITKKVVITQEEIDYYWEQMHYEYTLSQILLITEDEALEIREKIVEGGEDFADMAKRYSMGPEAKNGGNVGSESIGRIHWWIEEVLFDMEEGEVSPPVRTDNGWGLLKVQKKRKVLPNQEPEYAEKRLHAIKERKGRNALKSKIEQEIHLEIYGDAVEIAYNNLPEDYPFDDVINGKITRANAPKVEIPDKYRDLIICQYDDGIYTLADFEEKYEETALPERPRRAYGKENIVLLFKKMIGNKILPVYAEKIAKVLEVPEVRDSYDTRLEKFLVYRLYQDQIKDEVVVTDREIREYYNANKDLLRHKDKRNYQIILVEDEKTARMVEKMAKTGQDFTILAKKYSKDPSVAKNSGITGLDISGKYLEYDAAAFALPEVGAISGVFKVSRGWALVKLLETEPGGMPTYQESIFDIRRVLTENKSAAHLDDKIVEWRKEYIIEVNEDNLKKAQMNKDRPSVNTGDRFWLRSK